MAITNDSIIYQALCFVKLEKEYFNQSGEASSNPELANIRTIFNSVKREVLDSFPGYWCIKTETLNVNPDYEPNFYSLPADFISTKDSVIIESRIFQTANNALPGVRIVRLKSPQLTYVYDPLDLTLVPGKIIIYMQFKLLKRLMTQNIYEAGQAQLVQSAYEEAAREAQISYAHLNRLENLNNSQSIAMTSSSGGSLW